MKKKLLISTTVPETFAAFLKEQPRYLKDYFEVSLVTSPGEEINILIDSSASVYLVPMQRGISPFKDFISIIQMVKLILRLRPDIVHSYTPKAGLVCMISAWICRVPIRIHTFTGLIWPTSTGLLQRLLMLVDRLLCMCATHIVPEGEGVKQDLMAGHITSKNLKVIGYGNVAGVDIDYFSPYASGVYELSRDLKKQYEISNSDFTFIYVGRLNRDKGLQELISAFEQLPVRCRLLVVGALDKSAPIPFSLLNRLESHPRIHCLGFQQDIRPALMTANVLVLPSYREGFPNVLLQAGAMQLPVIATDINGCNEIIQPLLNGWLVSVKDVVELRRIMANVCETDAKVLFEMGCAARVRVLDRFERRKYLSNLLEFYKNITLA